MSLFIEQPDEQLLTWEQINWKQVGRTVRQPQERIYRATRLEPCAWRQARTVLCVARRMTHANVNTTMIYFHETGRTADPAEDYVAYDK